MYKRAAAFMLRMGITGPGHDHPLGTKRKNTDPRKQQSKPRPKRNARLAATKICAKSRGNAVAFTRCPTCATKLTTDHLAAHLKACKGTTATTSTKRSIFPTNGRGTMSHLDWTKTRWEKLVAKNGFERVETEEDLRREHEASLGKQRREKAKKQQGRITPKPPKRSANGAAIGVVLRDRLRIWRKNNHVTIGAAARIAGVEAALWTRWEDGAESPKPHVILRLNEAMRLPMSQIEALSKGAVVETIVIRRRVVSVQGSPSTTRNLVRCDGCGAEVRFNRLQSHKSSRCRGHLHKR